MEHGIPTNFTSEDLDLALARILSEPTWARRLLCAAAALLEEDTFLALNHWILTEALNEAKERTLAGLPGIVADEATERAIAQLPPTYKGESAGEYAAKLRAVAKELS